MNFGEPSPSSVDTAKGFMVERVKKTPPPGGIGLNILQFFYLQEDEGLGEMLVVDGDEPLVVGGDEPLAANGDELLVGDGVE